MDADAVPAGPPGGTGPTFAEVLGRLVRLTKIAGAPPPGAGPPARREGVSMTASR
jgi:hypothetical protein